MADIFISYRRGEDAWFAGRLFDRLERSFHRRLFMDVDSIAPGEDFVTVLNARVAECDVLLALIGRNWLSATDLYGQRRLDNPEDFVRIEIGAALAQDKRVIPVLIDDTVMPRADQLPVELRSLARRHATRLSHERFKADSGRLIKALKQVLTKAAAKAEPKNGVYIGVDPRDLPDFAVFKDIDAPWCPEMVVIPSGSFLMGSPPGEVGREDNEGPQHRVTISQRFAIGRYAVTFDEYDHFCEVTKRKRPKDAGWGRGRRPVISVSWGDAQAYLQWLAGETGHSYRLPSEAEWEYACRAGTTTPFSVGDAVTPEQVNYNGNSPYGNAKTGLYRKQTVPVGSLPANPWGLYEMHGNVSEWCHDGMKDYNAEAVTDPLGRIEPDAYRAMRGGSFSFNAECVRSAYRYSLFPGSATNDLGFRLSLRSGETRQASGPEER